MEGVALGSGWILGGQMIQPELTLEKPTAKNQILEYLRIVGPCAVHQILIRGVSQTAISARLREMARAGLVVSRFAEHKPFKVWELA